MFQEMRRKRRPGVETALYAGDDDRPYEWERSN